MSNNWKQTVYKSKDSNKRIGYNDNLDYFCVSLNYCCQACERKYIKRKLSLHHIVPVAEGGSNSRANLILVCWDCHNKIENNTQKLNSRRKISGVYKLDKRRRISPNKDYGTTWQSWVYGGRCNPINKDEV